MPGSLQAWADAIELEIAELTASIVPLQQRLDAAREKLDLVRRLIHLSSPTRYPPPTGAEPVTIAQLCVTPPGIEERIEDILRSSGKPMHIRDIRASLIQMGVPLPGRGDEANLILRLRRDSGRFVRTERGTYALVAWKLPAYSPTLRKKKVSRARTVKQ